MNINLDEVKLLLGGFVLDTFARDKVITDLTNKCNAYEAKLAELVPQQEPKIFGFPKELQNGTDVPSVE